MLRTWTNRYCKFRKENGTSQSPKSMRAHEGSQFLARNSLWLDSLIQAFGNAVFAAGQWGLIALLAQETSSSFLGQFAFALALASPVFLFAQLQLRGVLSSDVSRSIHFSFFLTARALCTVFSVGAVLCISFCLSISLEQLSILALVTMWKAVESLADIYYGLMQRWGCFRSLAFSRLLRGVCFVAGPWAIFRIEMSAVVAVASLPFSSFLCLLSWDQRVCSMLLHSVERSDVNKYLTTKAARRSMLFIYRKLILPFMHLGVVTSLVSVIVSVPRIALDYWHGSSVLGVFAAYSHTLAVGNIISVSLGQSLLPRLASACATKDKQAFSDLCKALTLVSLLVGIITCIGILLFGAYFVHFAFGSDFTGDIAALEILGVSAPFSFASSAIGYAILASGYHRTLVLPYVFTLGACSLMSVILVPGFGARGAAMAVTCSSAIGFALLLSVLRLVASRLHVATT